MLSGPLGKLGLRRVAVFHLADRGGDGIPRLVGLDFDGRPVGSRVGHRMAAIAVGLAFDELRPAARADAFECAPRRSYTLSTSIPSIFSAGML